MAAQYITILGDAIDISQETTAKSYGTIFLIYIHFSLISVLIQKLFANKYMFLLI